MPRPHENGYGSKIAEPDYYYWNDYLDSTCGNTIMSLGKINVVRAIEGIRPPAGSTVQSPLRFTWDAVTGASFYCVEIDSGASGRCRGVHGGREVTQPIYVRSTLESGKPFSVRIRAYREVTEDGFTFNRQIAEGSFTWPVAP